jgi:hypothetical protein
MKEEEGMEEEEEMKKDEGKITPQKSRHSPNRQMFTIPTKSNL